MLILLQKWQIWNCQIADWTWSNIIIHEYLSGNVPLQFAVSFGHMNLKLLIENGVSMFLSIGWWNCIDLCSQLQAKGNGWISHSKWCKYKSNLRQLLWCLIRKNSYFCFFNIGASLNAKDQDKRTLIEEGLIKKNNFLQNNDCIYSVLKLRDWINHDLVGTPMHAFWIFIVLTTDLYFPQLRGQLNFC